MKIEANGQRREPSFGVGCLRGVVVTTVFIWSILGSAQTLLLDGFNPDVEGSVFAMCLLPDGKISIGGDFRRVARQACMNIARLNKDGTLDKSFNPADVSLFVSSFALEPGGKILLGVSGPSDGQAHTNSVIRLNADGTLDAFFECTAVAHYISSIALQQDAKILVGGAFGHFPIRLNVNGSLDSGFKAFQEDPFDQVSLVLPQRDYKVLVVIAASWGPIALLRLNSDGSLDTGFTRYMVSWQDSTKPRTLVVQADGRILVAAATYLTNQNGAIVSRESTILRLNRDGTFDGTFGSGVGDGVIDSLALQTDGKILAAGDFITWEGQPRNGLVRLNPNGTLDAAFDASGGLPKPVPEFSFLTCAMLDADGKILIAGSFTNLFGHPRNGFARLNNTEPATQNLSYDGTTITWLRGGTSPEVWRTTFEASTNGVDWADLGAGQRISGGWQVTSVFVAANATIRARGFIADRIGSAGIVESTLLVTPELPPTICAIYGPIGVFDNKFGFEVCGSPGQVAVVESSTNLLQWFPLQTYVFESSPQYFTDPTWSESACRFYRLRQLLKP